MMSPKKKELTEKELLERLAEIKKKKVEEK